MDDIGAAETFFSYGSFPSLSTQRRGNLRQHRVQLQRYKRGIMPDVRIMRAIVLRGDGCRWDAGHAIEREGRASLTQTQQCGNSM